MGLLWTVKMISYLHLNLFESHIQNCLQYLDIDLRILSIMYSIQKCIRTSLSGSLSHISVHVWHLQTRIMISDSNTVYHLDLLLMA